MIHKLLIEFFNFAKIDQNVRKIQTFKKQSIGLKNFVYFKFSDSLNEFLNLLKFA